MIILFCFCLFYFFFYFSGDILAKSFKWIYAKVCLCRICPGLAKRRALRERRKMRARSMYYLDSSSENSENIDRHDVCIKNYEYYYKTYSYHPFKYLYIFEK